MKTMNRLAPLCLIVVALALTGCVKLWQENIDIKTYMVEVSRAGEPAEKMIAGKLWVDSVNVLPPYNVRNLILKKSDVEYTTSYYTELLMSPSENFRNELFVWLSDAGLFEEVSIVDRSGRTHTLVTSVLEFYGDTIEKKTVLRIKATLLDEKTRGNRVLFSKDYERHTALDDTNAESLIRAYNQALAEILTDLESDLASALK